MTDLDNRIEEVEHAMQNMDEDSVEYGVLQSRLDKLYEIADNKFEIEHG